MGSHARAEPVAKAELTKSSQGQTWSLRGATVAAPLERFPIFGFSFGVDLELSQRWRVSSTLTLQIPYSYGDVTRYLFALDAQAQLRLLSAWRLHWYAGLGIGVGIFHDEFAERSVFDNQTRVAPGLVASSTLEVNITTRLRAYLELRALAYRAKDIADNEWIQLGLGVRWTL